MVLYHNKISLSCTTKQWQLSHPVQLVRIKKAPVLCCQSIVFTPKETSGNIFLRRQKHKRLLKLKSKPYLSKQSNKVHPVTSVLVSTCELVCFLYDEDIGFLCVRIFAILVR